MPESALPQACPNDSAKSARRTGTRGNSKACIGGAAQPSASYGALTIRRGFWGPLYFNYNKEPPKIVLVSIKARILGFKVPLRVPLWHGPELSSFIKWEFPKVRVP